MLPFFSIAISQTILRYWYVILPLFWLATSLLINKKWMNGLWRSLIIISILFIIKFLYFAFSYGDLEVAHFVRLFLFLYITLMGYYYVRFSNQSQQKLVLYVIFSFFLITLATTSYQLINDDMVSRVMTSGSIDITTKRYLGMRNVGAYDFVYGTLFFIPVLFFFFINSFKKADYLFSFSLILTIILSCILIIFANFTIAYLLLIISILFVLIPKRFNINYLMLLFVGLIFILMYPYLTNILANLFYFLGEIVPGYNTQRNILGLADFLRQEVSIHSITIRWDLFMSSVRSFISSPIMGVGGYYGSKGLVGDHAYFVDVLARYGLIGALPLFIYIYIMFMKIRASIDQKKLKIIYTNSFILFIILGFLNPLRAVNIPFFMFSFVPLFIVIQDKKEKV